MPRDFATDAALQPQPKRDGPPILRSVAGDEALTRGNRKRVQQGGRNHGYPRRSGYDYVPQGFYVEPRWVVGLLLDEEHFTGEGLDPCCGIGTIVSVCRDRGLSIRGSDLVDRGFGEVRDMFDLPGMVDFIISNFPYGSKHDGRHIHERVEHCLELVRDKMALILPITFWESRERHAFFRQYPPVWWAPCSDRPSMPPGRMEGERDHNGAIIQPPASGGTAPYGWFLWRPGYRGLTTTKLLELKPKPTRVRRWT